MKDFILLLNLFCVIGASAAIAGRLDKRVNNKVNQQIERSLDNALNESKSAPERIESTSNLPVGYSTQNQVSSTFDFIPGDEVLFFEDFLNTTNGDFPLRWNTNGSGQVLNITSVEGNWLLVPDNTLTFPETKGALPENFTIEFDLYYPPNTTRPPITFGFSEEPNPTKPSFRSKKLFYFRIASGVSENIGYTTSFYSGRETTTRWETNSQAGKIHRVSLAVNGQRIRLYMNTEKLFDLPRAFDIYTLRNNFFFRSADLTPKPKDGFYISNVRIAKLTKDLRSSLTTDGRLVTSGIYFDSGSDKIKPVSYNLLNEIGTDMKKNSNSSFDIIGHTDTDGSNQMNEKLSLQRAEAVCQYLINNFNIPKTNLNAIGKGASNPISNNDTAEGKAQNRRVEFIKK